MLTKDGNMGCTNRALWMPANNSHHVFLPNKMLLVGFVCEK